MSDFIKKRKFEGDHNAHPRKSHKNQPRLHNQNGSQLPSAVHATLPALPQIDEKYRNLVYTHPSLAAEPNTNYERLEFLGDAYLELFASQLIFERFPLFPPGRMSQLRENLIKNETIGQYAVLYGMDKQLKNYKRFQNESSMAWLKIKGDIFEAYVAAVVVSSPDGADLAKNWLLQLWEPKLEAASTKAPPSMKSKEELAKKIAGKGIKINYEDEKAPVIHYGQGMETYFVGVYLTGWGYENQYLGSGKGLSRNEAGQAAATAALNNHPLIDDIAAKKADVYPQAKKEGTQSEDTKK